MPKERQTCTECSMRRQKCDRNLPCGRCVKRGDADKCTREWGPEGYDPSRHRVYPRTDSKSQHSPSSQHHSDTLGEDSPANPQSRRTSAILPHNDVNDSLVDPSLRNQSAHIVPSNNDSGQGKNIDELQTKVLDFLAWGRTPLANFQINSVELLKDPSAPATKDPTTDWTYSNGFGGTDTAQISFLQLLLPNRRQVHQLIEYHLSSITWYHAAIHGPTFAQELKIHLADTSGPQIRDMDLRWAALLFSLMAASMTCASDQQTTAWGFQKAERAKLTRQWFKATLSCLNLADYMWRHHIYSVQAIATLTMCAHILGFSNTQSTLMGAAMKIAQGLGLQRLGPEEDASGNPTGQKDKLVRRETGRRLWYQLCIQDWFSIPFSEMYSIQTHHFSTILPQYVHDETMAPIPSDLPTMATVANSLQGLARLMADSHDAVVLASTLYTKYEEVMKYEKKIKKWLADLPKCLKATEPIDPSWPKWVPWARRSMTLCYAHKIIMIHRNFLGRSFTEPSFYHTRDTCMTAAKLVLKEAKAAYEDNGPVLWIDQAFLVAAGITLSLDIFHRKTTEPEYEEHRKLVESDIALLSKYEDSMIAARGTRLLSSLLTEQARNSAAQSLDTYRSKRLREDGTQPPKTSSFATEPQQKRQRQKFDVPRFVESLGTPYADFMTKADTTSNQFVMPDLFGSSTNIPTSGPSNTTKQSTTTNLPTIYGDFTSPPASNYQPASTFTSSLRPHQFHSPAFAKPKSPNPNPNTKPQSQLQSPPSKQSPQSQPFNLSSNVTTTTTNNSKDPSIPKPNNTIINNNNITKSPSFPTNSNSNIITNTMTGGENNTTSNLEQIQFPAMDFGYETFEQLFPPQTGISNSFLFEDLLNFDF